MSKLFEELLKTDEFQKQLKLLPDEEKETVLKSLREIVEKFEDGIIKPLEKLKTK